MSTQGTIKRFTLIIQKTTGDFHPSFQELKDFLNEHGFEISPRTLQRDIEQIRNEFGIEIKYNRGKNGYSISEEEGVPTDTLVRFLEILGTAELFSENLRDGKELLNFISFEDQGNLKGIENLRLFITAIKNKRKLEFYHTNFDTGKRNHYTIQPYLLKEYQSRWYVYGAIGSGTIFRTFGLDRIDEIKVKSDTFKPIKGLDPKKVFEDVIGLYYTDIETEEVIIEVDTLQSKYLKALPLHSSQVIISENKDKVLIKYFLKPNFELTQKIIMMCDRAVVVKPKWLANEIKATLKSVLNKYGK